MTSIRHERLVAASPLVVWGVLADFDGIARWAAPVDHSSSLTARSEGVGTQRRVQSGRTVLLEEVTVWEPEARLAYELVGLPPVVRRATNEWTLTPEGEMTRATLTVDVVPGPRPPMRVAAYAVARRIAAVNRRLLDGLVTAVAARKAVS